MSWTDERVEMLKKMWGEGQSASQIAKELGGVTRNAVIGKVHRLGLSNRASGSTKAEPKAKAAPKAEARPKAAPKAAEPAAKTAEPAAPKPIPARKQIIPAGQPLPPQPSANEISPEALAKVVEKHIAGFGELFRWLSFQKIGTSTVQSRADAGVAGGTYIFVLPGSPGACRDGWDGILQDQLDIRHRPCNFAELLPRLTETDAASA